MSYQFLNQPIDSFHLEITSKCALACPRCPRTIYKGEYKVEDLPLELIKKRFTPEILDPVRFILMCGDHGDPIYHSQFHEVIGYFKEHGKKLTINTNGSRRKAEWWEKTVDILEKRDWIKFSIDGLEDTNHLYRQKSQWNDIRDAIEICRGKTTMIWKFIVFKHNQHQVHKAEKLAEQMGFDQFVIVRSHLFGKDWLKEGETEDPFMPDSEWLDPKYFADLEGKKKPSPPEKAYQELKSSKGFAKVKDLWRSLRSSSPIVDKVSKETKEIVKEKVKEIRAKENFSELKIYPKCKFGKVHYVNASGYYLPCCWAGNHDLLEDFFKHFNENGFDLNHHSFEEILSSETMRQAELTWRNAQKSPRVCQLHCAGHQAPEGWEHSYDVESRDL